MRPPPHSPPFALPFPRTAALRLGEILRAAGDITEKQRADVLERRARSGRRIGEEWVAARWLSTARVRRALRMQRRLVLAALLSAMSGAVQAAEVRAVMGISARVVDSVGIRAIAQAQSLVITPQDVARGYVDVPGASRFEISTRGSSLFEFRNTDDVFRSVRITGLPAAAEFGAEGGSIVQRAVGSGVTTVALNYRFALKPGVTPGTRNWPLTLTVLPL